jgi:DNA-binding LacI/PurR family transcriptional regulator
MAKLKQTIKAILSSSGVVADVFLPENLAPFLAKIDGIRQVCKMTGYWMVFFDPRYDVDEVIEEIENLDAPIPSAFTDDTPETE